MGTPKPTHHEPQPAENQPRREQTLRIDLERRTKEAPLPRLPTAPTHKQRPHHRTERVLHIGNQLNRQQRKGPLVFAAQKAGNRNPALLKTRKQLNGIPPVGGNRPVAIKIATDRASTAKEGEKIDPTGQKRFSVFPKRLESVIVGQLNLSAPCSRGAGLWAAQNFGTASLVSLVIFPRSIPYLAISSILISSVKTLRKRPFLYCELYLGR